MFVFIQISIVCPGFFSLSCFTLGKLLKKVLPWKLVHSLEPSLYLYIYRHFRKLCLMNNFEYAEKYFLLWFDVIIHIFCFNAKEAQIHNMTVVNFCANFPKFDIFIIESAVTMAKRRFFLRGFSLLFSGFLSFHYLYIRISIFFSHHLWGRCAYLWWLGQLILLLFLFVFRDGVC